ncbi:unnamed protein product [Ectocarpus sp. CCAP 1310/34]|nr:unnamed protein product [Ectocarpus sp. CCAP 1310/34]
MMEGEGEVESSGFPERWASCRSCGSASSWPSLGAKRFRAATSAWAL